MNDSSSRGAAVARAASPAPAPRHDSRATLRRLRAALLPVGMVALLAGCAIVDRPVRPAIYDFGPGSPAAAVPAPATAAVLLLPEVESGAALDSTAVMYRLAYADAQQLQPYTQARWSMTPAQLLRQRLRESLSQGAAVLAPGEGNLGGGAAPMVLHVELEEFSQIFDAPQSSAGLVRVRATAVRSGPAGDRLLGQRSFSAQRAAPSADAPGGVRALTAASHAVVEDLRQWLTTLP